MTTPARLEAVLALATALAACTLFHADFDIAVGNRTGNTVSIFANGGKVGEVGSNQTARFTLREEPTGSVAIESVASPTSSTLFVQLTFSAQDMTTGTLSAGVAATLVKDVTTYVDVAPCVIVGLIAGGPAPPCVSVSGATIDSQVPGCTFSLSGSDRSFTATGGSGSVSVNTSSGCAWTATSSAPWLTISSGSSGTGTGVVAFEVAANSTGQARSAFLSIAGQTFTVNQAV